VEKLRRALWASLFAIASSACGTKLHAPLVFLPVGTSIVAGSESGVVALDLRTGKPLWEHAVERRLAKIAASPGGDFVLVQYAATAARGSPSAFVVLSSATGQVTGRVTDPAASLVYTDDAPVRVDGGRPPHLVSDDGKWFVSASFAGLRIFEVPTAKLAFEDADAYGPAGFQLGSSQLAVVTKNGLGIYAVANGGWARIAEIPQVFHFWWTSRGLFFLVGDTLHVWRDGASSALLQLKIEASDVGGRHIFFDESGDRVAVQTPETELVIYTLPAGDTVLRVPKVRDLRAVMFDGSIARVLTYVTESDDRRAVVTEYDLSNGQQRGRVELEIVQRLERRGFFSFGLGGGWQSYRSYMLGPRGLFVGKLEKGDFEMKAMPWAK